MGKLKTYNRPVSGTWFLARKNYVLFMIREMTSVFVVIFAVEMLMVISHLHDAQAFADCMAAMNSPLAKVWHLLVLVAACWHACTWWNLTPKAMPQFIGEKRVPDHLVAIGMGYGPWVVVTVLVVFLLNG